MSYNGSGTFLINTAGQPVVSGTVISSTAFNALTADLATGLSTAITKDGQTTVTANIPMSTYKFTGLGVGSAATDSANLSQVQSTVTKLLNSVSGADTITATASPTLAAYAAGQMFYFVAAGDNTTSVTLNIDSLGAKAVTRDGATALAAADIKSGEVVVVVYDGTRFQVVSQLNSAGDARFANVSIASSLNVGGVVTLSGGTANGVAYLNGSKALTSGSTLTFDGTTFANGAAWTTNPMASTQPQYFQYAAGTNFFQLAGDAGVGIRAVRFSNDASNPLIFLGKGRGTYASPAAVQTGDVAGNVRYDVYGGTNQRNIANILGGVETYTSDSNISGYLAFGTSPSGAANSSEKMRLTAAGDLGIGTTSPGVKLDVVGAIRSSTTTSGSTVSATTDFRLNNATFSRIAIGDGGGGFVGGYNITYSGGAVYDSTGSISGIYKTNGGNIQFYAGGSAAAGTAAPERMRITSAGNIVAGASAALATTATDGFLYVPTCAGTPTGTPTAITGMAPIVINTTNNKLYFYSGGAWRDAGP